MSVVATVGTTHPLAFAGLPLALIAIADLGLRPVCVVAGVTAQTAGAVTARAPLAPEIIAAQFAALHDAAPAAFHVGALLDAASVHAVADGLAAFPGVPVVLDPVFATSDGFALPDRAARAALLERLVPRAAVVTPNLDEAAALTGIPIDDFTGMQSAGRALVARGARAVLVKGGHRLDDASDVLVDGDHAHVLPGARIGGGMRGTGDLLAVRIACGLARGGSLHEAVHQARHAVRHAIAGAETFAGARVRPV